MLNIQPAGCVDVLTEKLTVDVIIPCLDEAAAIECCVRGAKAALDARGWEGQVVVVDNGSTDRSGEIAASSGAVVVEECRRGYGSAYLAGFAASTADCVVMADGDGTYDFSELGVLVDELRAGADLVIGTRLGESMNPDSMTFLRRRVGNPAAGLLMNKVFSVNLSDPYSGIRAVTQHAYKQLGMRAQGMEFALEMLLRAREVGLEIAEVPIDYLPRQGESKFREVRDVMRTASFLTRHGVSAAFTERV